MSDEQDEAGEPSLVSRRRVLKVLGLAPLAGAMGLAEAQPTQPPVRQPHTTPNQPTNATPPASSQPKRTFFTAREWKTVGVLADDIIPRDERSGSATQAGVPAYIDFHMSVAETSDETRVAMRGGLRWLDTESKRRFGVAYDRAKEAQRHEILDDISGPPAQAKPEMRAGTAFFSQFRNMVASGFFSSAVGWKDLQYIGNTFVPTWNGCPEPALRKLGVSYDLMSTRVKPA
jgi:hypothetical protein